MACDGSSIRLCELLRLLRDPLIRLRMDADGVSEAEIISLMQTVAEARSRHAKSKLDTSSRPAALLGIDCEQSSMRGWRARPGELQHKIGDLADGF